MADTKNTPQRFLAPNSLSIAEYTRTVHFTFVPVGTSKADILTPAFWTHVTNKLKTNDIIEVMCEDGSWRAELIVTQMDRVWAKVKELSFVELSAGDKGDTPDAEFAVRWSGPHTKFRVIRAADKAVIKDGFEAVEAGQAWLADYLKALKL